MSRLAESDLSFEFLMNQAKTGNSDALAQLLEAYRARLKVFASFLLRNTSRTSVDVSDVVQETNLKAVAHFQSIQGNQEGKLAKWLRTTLRNHVTNVIVSQNRPGRRPKSLDHLIEHGSLVAEDSTPINQMIKREQADIVKDIIKELQPNYQQVLDLYYLKNLGHQEIGEKMGKDAEYARKLLYRATEALRKKLI